MYNVIFKFKTFNYTCFNFITAFNHYYFTFCMFLFLYCMKVRPNRNNKCNLNWTSCKQSKLTPHCELNFTTLQSVYLAFVCWEHFQKRGKMIKHFWEISTLQYLQYVLSMLCINNLNCVNKWQLKCYRMQRYSQGGWMQWANCTPKPTYIIC